MTEKKMIEIMFYNPHGTINFKYSMEEVKEVKFQAIRQLINKNYVLYNHGNYVYEDTNKTIVINKALRYINTNHYL